MGGCTEGRRLDFDWLRVIIILLVMVCHSGLLLCGYLFGADRHFPEFWHYWHVSTAWLMPVMFFLAGASSRLALRKRTALEYAKERFTRLFIPCLFGTLMVVPVQVYVERLYKGQFEGSYLAFYPTFFNGLYPVGNFGYAHLWFICYLFVLSLVALPVFVFLKGPRGQRLIDGLAALCQWRYAIFLVIVPAALTQFLLAPLFPWNWVIFADWAMFTWYLVFLITGYVVGTDVRFWRAIERNGPLALTAGACIIVVDYVIRAKQLGMTELDHSAAWAFFATLDASRTWLLSLTVLWLGSRFLRVNDPALPYLREASYPFYILHQSVMAVITYFLLRGQAATSVAFAVNMAGTVVGTAIVYDLCVRRWRVMRFLFGMKAELPSKGPVGEPEPAPAAD